VINELFGKFSRKEQCHGQFHSTRCLLREVTTSWSVICGASHSKQS
jgi:hypothetical protein